MTAEALAPAKVNLTLHVTGQRQDGYHLLDSLVVFGGFGDRITARPARELSLTVTGPFSTGVPRDESNLVLRAARMLQETQSVPVGAAITLDKQLPHAAGIGSGSSDAATTLRLLSQMWGVPCPAPSDPRVAALGADVPVCLAGPTPMRMSGIGDVLHPLPALPHAAMILVNPRIELATGPVFAAMKHKNNPPQEPVPEGMEFGDLVDWLSRQRNDMLPAALGIAPEIGAVLDRIAALPAARFVTMSGSGATCVALVEDMDKAVTTARALQIAEMGWWVAPAPLLLA